MKKDLRRKKSKSSGSLQGLMLLFLLFVVSQLVFYQTSNAETETKQTVSEVDPTTKEDLKKARKKAAKELKERERKQNISEAYPTTPEGVVEAYIKELFKDVPISTEEDPCAFRLTEMQGKQHEYVLEKGPEGPGWDCFDVGTGYEIKEVRKGKQKASVKVLYKRLGRLCASYYITGTKKTLLTTAKEIAKEQYGREEYNHLLYMTNDTEGVKYSLIKEDGLWLIKWKYYPTYISVSVAIKELEFIMTKCPRRVKTEPSETEKVEIKRVIKLLENHLKK